MSSLLSLLPLLAILCAAPAHAQWCYDRYGYRYRCNSSGISYGARIGIGLGVAAAVILVFGLCGYWRRRQIRNQFAKHRPPGLPFTNNNQDPSNPYANNPPPPAPGTYAGQGNSTNWSQNSYGNNPPPPEQTYQPSMAGQYGVNADKNGSGGDHEHGYEWEQAREQERLEREQNGQAPPGYDVANSAQNTGTGSGYAPPPGPPPAKH
ncbi:hypothetical protein DB88DRAFT_487039 [Papiliotrema laurentii]|uniref:Uncharacterized protein n=1 Tax=Papiliotrema laurentii TaxID=5418 RepID=A0AAD9FRR0_PAPLA|nr:hypothetical protein DB88DRAFT_487039 [Papiliotrema laurentii]